MTMRDLHVFARYLRELHSKSVLDATSADIGAYRRLRREGPMQLRLAGSSWKRASIALTRFYQWAASEEGGLLAKAPRTKFRRDGAHSEDTVRMVSLDDYVAFRDRALMGERRRTPLRDAAFAELLVTTGMRQQLRQAEWGSPKSFADCSTHGSGKTTRVFRWKIGETQARPARPSA